MSQAAAEAAIRERLEVLQARSLEELAVLPEWSSVNTVVEDLATRITTYRENEGGGLRIIVQLVTNERPFLVIFRSSQVFVEGFERQPDGAVRPLRQDEMYAYN